jgi:hypothetical protein
MQERLVEKTDYSFSEVELNRRREKLESAMVQFEPNLLMDIRLFLEKFNEN